MLSGRRLVAASFLALSPTGGQAQTAWEEHVLRGPDGAFESCAAVRNYNDGTTMVLDASAEGQLHVILANPAFSVPALSTESVDVTVDDGLTHRLPASVIPHGFIVDLQSDRLMPTLLAKGTWVDFRGLDDLRYSLDGMEAVLTALFDCRDRFITAARAAAPSPAPSLAPSAAPSAAPAPPAKPRQGLARYAAELDTYVRADAAMEDWENLKKSLSKSGAQLYGRSPVLAPRRRVRDGRRFLVMMVPGFDSETAAANFCGFFKKLQRRCVVVGGN